MNVRLRLLPTVLIATSLLLAVKVGAVWQQGDVILSGISPARAESAPAPDATAKAAAKPAEAPAAQDAHQAAPAAEGQAPPAETAAAEPADPTTMSKGEVELLQGLSQRREQLDARARDLDMREKLLAATEGRIDEKIAELKALEAKIDGMIKTHDAAEDAQLASLVKVYESMKPKDAARIFDKLDMAILITVAERMKEQKMAAVLAEMTPDSAKALTVELATRHRLPATGG
jgi:flagellar motility protein MotE (MotC chaperone)